MNNRPQTHSIRKVFLVDLSIVAGILNWLASLIKLTEQEQEDAGIYIGRQGEE